MVGSSTGGGAPCRNAAAACVSCGAVHHWQKIQCGHWIPKARGNATAWDLRNLHPQCYRCNINLQGNGPEYTMYMLERYGRKTCDELRRLSGTTRKITRVEYEEMIEQMAEKLADLITRRASCDIPRVDIRTARD